MPRLTVTLDDELTNELHELPIAELRRLLDSVLGSESTIGDDRASIWSRLARSLDELGEDPSAAAVMRQALRFYNAALDDARREAELGAGYSALARDSERAEMLGSQAASAPGRWADEA